MRTKPAVVPVLPGLLSLGLLSLASLAGCGLDLDFPSDSDDETADLSGIIDLSVNDASAVAAEGGGLRLRTEEGDNEVGGFNGPGTGNKSIGGLPGWDGEPLAELSGLAMETRQDAGSSTPYFNLVVDLDCSATSYTVVVADATLVSAPEDLGDGSLRYAYDAAAPQWKAVGGLGDLLPEHLASTGGTLSSVVEAWPEACLRDADTGDNGLPADTVTSAVLIILGDSVNHSAYEHHVSALEVGDTRYE